MRIESDVTSRSRAGAVSQRDEGSGVARVLAERSGARRVTKASRELVAASVLTLALATFAPLTVADPTDIDPDLAARDADYAAGRKAAEQKDWPQAVQRFELALKRNPDHRQGTDLPGPLQHAGAQAAVGGAARRVSKTGVFRATDGIHPDEVARLRHSLARR